MSLRHRHPPPAAAGATGRDEEPFNIIPVHNLLADHPSLRFPEVRAAVAALRSVGDLRRPPFGQWRSNMDLLDWLALFFGFQRDNVRNQREHLVLHLANAQMRLTPPPDNIDTLDAGVLRRFRKKLLKNYGAWCSYLGKKSNIWISDNRRGGAGDDLRRELLYVSLYLLIWGEAANLRFMPECICYIFHNMANELNRILEDFIDENTGQPVMPSISGENAFLNSVVKPIYDTIRREVDSSRNGTAPHSAWRNYDDINEYFWSRRCFEKLKWPLDVGSNFFVTAGGGGKQVGKTGFVEQRSFWNLFRSFDRLWVMLILFLQAAIIVAWEERTYPWQALEDRTVQVRVLTIFFTWTGLRFVQSLLDMGMQYRLVSRETIGLGVRMVLKCVVAAAWIVVFVVFYARIWTQRDHDRRWSPAANKRVVNFLQAVLVFIIPELLALALFVLPWIRNFVENTNWRIFYMLSWWFQSRSFVGRGLREGLVDNVKYSVFWIVVLATKFCFSYFLQVKPMIAPSKAVLDLKNVNYEWHQFFHNSNRFAVGLLWLPVVLIYLMDIQIWYSIYSSFAGAGVGLFAHLGEIRNMQQLKLRFQFFASAIQFNLMPEEQLLNTRRTLKSKFKDAIHRLKLRYGLGRPYRKLESNQIEANKFALIWNEIILSFREEDIISDKEFELLELPENSWNVRVIRWPCFLLCNELLLALSQAKELVDDSDKRLCTKICKSEYRRCAVIEAYDSVKHLLLEIIKHNTEEHSIVTVLFQEIGHSLEIEKFTKLFNTTALPKLHNKLIKLVQLLNRPVKDPNQVVNTLQALYEIAIRDFFKEQRNPEQLKEDGLAQQNPASGLLFENAIQLPDTSNENFYRQVRRLHTILTSNDSMQNIPVNLEARRRIAFFSNSLFMNMPHAPQVEKMMAFSVLTPYYSEEVLYNKEQLRNENEDGVSILYYLQTIYDDEWKNFMERMRREGMTKDSDLWTDKLRDLRLWASYRGQTLSRTVRGMMYYYRALKMLTFLDSASEMDIREGARELVSMRPDSLGSSNSERSPSSRSLSRGSSSVSLLFKGHEYGTALMKFTYVIACQIYGTQKEKKDPHADEILYLMKKNEALRVAYVDEKTSGRDEKDYYSVLVKYDQQLQREVEIYRVKLPGPLKLGEGKPENQNHAIIFTRGDAVQTIDMNQDNYFEEALKMRNLLEEYRHYYGIRRPTILGVREHIFTGSVSSLAWFMSAQETSFVTLGQRVLANPLKVRMHYGHPDVFDRFWFLTRGGISKASRVINISEDIFAGFNCTLRGGNVTHHEYIQVGKGRDVGLNQVSMFEAKVASGNGEQVLSRDVYRLGHRLDFFRMLSFFYTTVGFFFNTMMVILTVYAFLWCRLYLALSGVENAMENKRDDHSAKEVGNSTNTENMVGNDISVSLTLENGNKTSKEHLLDNNSSPSTRSRVYSADDYLTEHFDRKQVCLNECDDFCRTSKRVKFSASTSFESKKEKPVSQLKQEVSEHLTERILLVSERGDHHVENNNKETLGGGSSEDIPNKCTVSKLCQPSSHIEVPRDESNTPFNDALMLQPTFGAENSKQLQVESIPHVSLADGILLEISGSKHRSKLEKGLQLKDPNDSQQQIAGVKAPDHTGNGCGVEKSGDIVYQGEKISLEMEKQAEQNLCLKCNESDQLPISDVNVIQSVVTECCLGMTTTLPTNDAKAEKNQQIINLQQPKQTEPDITALNLSQEPVVCDKTIVGAVIGCEAEQSSDSDGYHNEKKCLEAKKHEFLRSHFTVDQDFSAMNELNKQNLCMKCNQGGQLLACKTTTCPLMVHEDCLGSSVQLDAEGNFFCPFCAYSRTISEYVEAKEKASLARKDLTIFISKGKMSQAADNLLYEFRTQEHCFSRKSSECEHIHVKNNKDDQLTRCEDNREDHVGEHANEANNLQFGRSEQQNSSCREKENVSNGSVEILREEKIGEMRNAKNITGVRVEENEVPTDHVDGHDVDTCTGEKTNNALVNKSNAGYETPQEMTKQQAIDGATEPVCAHNTGKEEMSEIECDKHSTSSSRYSMRYRKHEMQCKPQARPVFQGNQLRRKKIPWTAEEEDMLREGVQKFGFDDPRKWKNILAFGSHVFEKVGKRRTSQDLKDKWKNMCKAHSKSK